MRSASAVVECIAPVVRLADVKSPQTREMTLESRVRSSLLVGLFDPAGVQSLQIRGMTLESEGFAKINKKRVVVDCRKMSRLSDSVSACPAIAMTVVEHCNIVR